MKNSGESCGSRVGKYSCLSWAVHGTATVIGCELSRALPFVTAGVEGCDRYRVVECRNLRGRS
jgi:hypothetical protein